MVRIIKRRTVIIVIMALIAAIHIFRIGNLLKGDLFYFYYSYFSDFIIPFGGYYLLCAAEQQFPSLQNWKIKLAIMLLVPSIAETAQFFGIPVLGSTFDSFDYVMYALGGTLAAIFDTLIFPRLFKFWSIGR